jgi:hypothetical protein
MFHYVGNKTSLNLDIKFKLQFLMLFPVWVLFQVRQEGSRKDQIWRNVSQAVISWVYQGRPSQSNMAELWKW